MTREFSAGRIEQVTYSRRPPGRSSGQQARSSPSWRAAKPAISLARRNSLMSGWRRMTPVPEHGASSRIASKGWPSHQSGARAEIRVHQPRVAPQPLQVVGDPPEALGVAVERGELRSGRRPAPAARRSCRRARRRHPGCARPGAAPATGPPAARSNPAPTRGPPQNPGPRTAAAPRSSVTAVSTLATGSPRSPAPSSSSRYSSIADTAGVDAQAQRRMLIVGRQDRLELLGPRRLEFRHQPRRVRRARGQVAIHRGQARIALAQVAAQDRVDHSGRARRARGAARHRPPRPPSWPADAASIRSDGPRCTSSARRRASVCAADRASSGNTAGASRRYQRSVPSATAWMAARCGSMGRRRQGVLGARAFRQHSGHRARPRRCSTSAAVPGGRAAARVRRGQGALSAEPQPVDRVAVREIHGAERAPAGALQPLDRQLPLAAGHQQAPAVECEHRAGRIACGRAAADARLRPPDLERLAVEQRVRHRPADCSR